MFDSREIILLYARSSWNSLLIFKHNFDICIRLLDWCLKLFWIEFVNTLCLYKCFKKFSFIFFWEGGGLEVVNLIWPSSETISGLCHCCRNRIRSPLEPQWLGPLCGAEKENRCQYQQITTCLSLRGCRG